MDAGGSVGFAPPAPVPLVAAALDRLLAGVAAGDVLGALVTDDDQAVGMGVLVDPRSWVFPHWRSLVRVMVAPSLQGTGAGSLLLAGLHGTARGLGLEQLRLTVRDGEGLEGFYGRFGYEVIGRHPGAIRLPDGDRDELTMRVVL